MEWEKRLTLIWFDVWLFARQIFAVWEMARTALVTDNRLTLVCLNRLNPNNTREKL